MMLTRPSLRRTGTLPRVRRSNLEPNLRLRSVLPYSKEVDRPLEFLCNQHAPEPHSVLGSSCCSQQLEAGR